MVNQESGAATLNDKNVIPVVWDMDPAQLPGWLHEYQALDLRGDDAQQIRSRVESLVQKLAREKQQRQVIGAVALVGLAAIAIFAK
jgi:broad specificity phosphatase PhoE